MNFDRVRVRGLFDHFDHDLEFRTDERVMIVIGPNGFGKTTTLRLIDALFNQSLLRLAEMSFRSMEVSFDQGKSLIVEKKDHTEQDDDGPKSKLIFQDGNGESWTFRPRVRRRQTFYSRTRRRRIERLKMVDVIEDIVPILTRVGVNLWRNRETRELLDLDDVLTLYQHELDLGRPSRLPPWLQDVIDAVTVRFIDTERLTRTDHPKRTIRFYSDELAGLVSKTIAEYAALSQSLDRTFPARLVTGDGTSKKSIRKLVSDLDEIKRNQSRLEEAGLLSTDHDSIDIPDLNNVDPSRLDVLSVYAQDTKQKLEVFDDLYPKIYAFMTIANARLRYKRVSVSAEGLKVVSWTGADLDLDLLSSGEQHELVILYELLFRTSKNSLILIDEPELSLHVAWQEQFVTDLEKMAGISDFRAILATHSPEIIADRWDLTVELSGPNGE